MELMQPVTGHQKLLVMVSEDQPFQETWEAQSSPRLEREIWGLRSGHCRAEETSPMRVSGT